MKSFFGLVRGFWLNLSSRRKRQLMVLLVMMAATSFAEVLSLGAVLPFLGVLTQPDKVLEYPALRPIFQWLSITTAQELLLPITLTFIAAALLAGGMRLILLYAQTKLSYAIGADFSYQAYRRTLYQPYIVHISRNSSDIISGVTAKTTMIINYLVMPLLTALSSTAILIAILASLLAVNPMMSLVAFAGFGAIYGGIIFLTRRQLNLCSERISVESGQVIKVLQEGLGGIRDVLIDGAQETYCEQYRRADMLLRHAQANSTIIGQSPRFAAEALGMAFIAGLAYVIAQREGSVSDAIVLLGALALGAQRILPVLQQGYLAITQLRSGRHSLKDALEIISQPIDQAIYRTQSTALAFRHSIELRDLRFRYAAESKEVLRGVTLKIARGSRIGFIGTTGSGKSTLLDIVMGLLHATDGGVWIDDVRLEPATQRNWQQRIAHVPQFIYLSDASIAENIAFGIPMVEIDMQRVQRAADQAQISSYVASLPGGYKTRVGESGVRLSGGQRQRIGIARALYKQAELIVFDEATSALDIETENAVMSAINDLGPDLTVLIIAHRLSTLRGCDQLVELKAGRVSRVGTYMQLVGARPGS